MTIYLEHFGLNEAPFKITPHTEFFFAGANRGETLEALIYAITSGEGMVKVTGEVGAGKTMLCRVLMERLPDSVETIYLAVPSLAPDEMLATIADDLGVDVHGGNTTKLIRALQERLIATHAQGKQVVALIDEAHAMPLETLEEIRLLSNLETSHDKLMQIVLFGQPELDQHLMLPNMRQLKERITHSFNLLPLPARDIKDYLNFRLRAAGYKGPDLFSPDALKLIAEASEGLTRRINIYADKTLLAAYAANTHTITPDHVRAAISDTQIVLPGAKNDRSRWFAVAASLLVGSAIGFMAGRMTATGGAGTVAPPTTMVTTPIATRAPEVPAAGSAAVVGTSTNVAPAAQTGPDVAVAPIVETPGSTRNTNTATTPDAKTKDADAPAAIVLAAVSRPDVTQSTAPVNLAPASNRAPPEADKTSSSDWLDARMDADVLRLAELPADRHSIQLMTAHPQEKSAIENFLRAASQELNPDRIMVYPAGTSENLRVSVLYGSFVKRAEATDEMLKLSARLAKFRPYVRSVGAIREDLRPRTDKVAGSK
ncbi:MAG: AAA family ATPase [Betaproteobacteria bacterium]|nr:AAA family ATPase [Betaproteobacteria bacterium]